MILSVVKTTGTVIFLSFKYLVMGIIHVIKSFKKSKDSEEN